MPVIFLYDADLCGKHHPGIYCDRISTFHDIWKKPNFKPERFLNEADLVRKEI